MNVFFDVQGSLVFGGNSRPQAREVLQRLAEKMDRRVYLWSSGASYAARAARLLDVLHTVFGCFGRYVPRPGA